jgi:hypothetical protein
LTEFKASRSIVNTFGPNQPTINNGVITVTTDVCLKKLQFIDSIIGKYQDNYWQEELQDVPKSLQNRNFEQETAKNKTSRNRSFLAAGSIEDEEIIKSNKSQKATEKPGVLPRSFVNTFNRIKQEIDPQAEESEEAVLKKFRNSRYKTAISLKFILLLIIVPLLTQQLTKTFLITPLVNKYFQQQEQFIFINQDLEEEAFSELRRFEEALHFRGMIGLAPKLSNEEIEVEIIKKAAVLSEEFRQQGLNAIANIFADICSLIAFGFVVAFSRREIEIVKSFLDGILYNLSDSAKAFLIILFTDIFVGFHSPHGWEVILEGLSRHFGLPENRQFNFLFIATFPVILDTVLKYWIFRYLNRISPSAVATYRNMNE